MELGRDIGRGEELLELLERNEADSYDAAIGACNALPGLLSENATSQISIGFVPSDGQTPSPCSRSPLLRYLPHNPSYSPF